MFFTRLRLINSEKGRKHIYTLKNIVTPITIVIISEGIQKKNQRQYINAKSSTLPADASRQRLFHDYFIVQKGYFQTPRGYVIYHMGEVNTHKTNKGICSMHSWEYLCTECNSIKRVDSTNCDFHLVRFPNARRFNLSRDTVDCQINIPISIY